MSEKDFGGVIWTKHALQRLRERNIKQGDAWAVWRRPDKSEYASSKNAWVYYRTFGDTKIEVVAKQNEKNEWIILSVWSKKVFPKNKKKEKGVLVLIIDKLFKNKT